MRKIYIGTLKASILYHTYMTQFWNWLFKAGILSADRVFKPIMRHCLCNLRSLAGLVEIGECQPSEDLMSELNEFVSSLEK